MQVGTNQLIGTDFDDIMKASLTILGGIKKNGQVPELWDGKTSHRIVSIIMDKLKIQ